MNNRRNFLKKLGMVLGVTAVAPVLISAVLKEPENNVIPSDITVQFTIPEPVTIKLPKNSPGVTYRIINHSNGKVTIINE